jgi:hypothetical protein
MRARHAQAARADWDQVAARDAARFGAGLLLAGFECLEEARILAANEPDIQRVVEAFARTGAGTAQDAVLALDVPGDDMGALLALDCMRYAGHVTRQARQRGRLESKLTRARQAIADEQRQARRALHASEAHRRATAASVRAVADLRFSGEA